LLPKDENGRFRWIHPFYYQPDDLNYKSATMLSEGMFRNKEKIWWNQFGISAVIEAKGKIRRKIIDTSIETVTISSLISNSTNIKLLDFRIYSHVMCTDIILFASRSLNSITLVYIFWITKTIKLIETLKEIKIIKGNCKLKH
jgi:hypothetical protein